MGSDSGRMSAMSSPGHANHNSIKVIFFNHPLTSNHSLVLILVTSESLLFILIGQIGGQGLVTPHHHGYGVINGMGHLFRLVDR